MILFFHIISIQLLLCCFFRFLGLLLHVEDQPVDRTGIRKLLFREAVGHEKTGIPELFHFLKDFLV
jgi:hypothetical protein